MMSVAVITAVVVGISAGVAVDLRHAVVVADTARPVHAKAVELLEVEVLKRTGIRLQHQGSMPESHIPAIVLGTAEATPGGAPKWPAGLQAPEKAEGYALWVDTESRGAPTVYLVGRDDRGVLFAAGRLLRLITMREGELTLDGDIRLASAPEYPIRGHQIGYRDTANSYDAWDVNQYEQYIRDLVVFGVNSIELIPPLDPSERDSPHMPLTMWDMTVKLCALLDSYGLDVGFWQPLDADVTNPTVARDQLEKRRVLFQACKRLDAVFVPGGDPGDTPPNILMPWLGQLANVLHHVHPKAGLWVSNQGFTHEENDFLFGYLEREKPDWLAGVAYGPWAKLTLREMRKRTPRQYQLRRYPDITHCVRCQYPVPEWDRAFAHTLGREPANPRPQATAHIHNVFAAYADGFVTYSDGVNDDVNKIVWSALGWDPQAEVPDVLKEYGRYFFGEDLAGSVTEGLLALEQNWQGPLARNRYVERTLSHWQEIEKRARGQLETNWRLQLALLRAYYDAYVQRRLANETQLEDKAYAELKKANEIGVEKAIASAREALARADSSPAAPELRKRIEELGETLYKSIGMQLDVKQYKAANPERGAVLEFLDQPLNNRDWLEQEFDQILGSSASDSAKLAQVQEILNWENPGPGGFYDDLGNATKQPHLLRQKVWRADPGFVESPQEEFSGYKPGMRLSWLDQAETLYGTPLRLRYEGLDPAVAYQLRVVYAGRFRATMRLVAEGQYQIHGPFAQPEPVGPVEFTVPREATSDGVLELEWQLVDGRGCQVAEVWLLPQG